MDQPFESDVMDDLSAESSFSPADEAFDEFEGMEEEGFEGFEEEDSFSEEMDMGEFEAEGDAAFLAEEEFAEGFEADLGGDYLNQSGTDELDALEDAVADALDAEDTDEFFRQLLGGVSRIARSASRGAGTVRRVAQNVGQAAQTAQRVGRRVQRVAGRAGRAANPVASVLGQLLPLLQQYAAQGFDEFDALEDLAEQFADTDLDEALPVLAGMAARTMVTPLLRGAGRQLSRPLRRQLVRTTTQATRTLIRRQGPRAVRALPRIAQSVGRTAVHRRLPVGRLPQAIRQTGVRIAARPDVVRRLSRPTAIAMGRPPSGRPAGKGIPQRLRLRGPVEITITRL